MVTHIRNVLYLGLVVLLSASLVSCSSDDATSQASALILAQAADEAEALEIVKETCRANEGNFISRQLFDDFTQAAQLDDQYSDDVAVLLYFRYLASFGTKDGIPVSPPADAVNLSRPMTDQLTATCRIAGVEWKYIDYLYE